MNQFEQLAQATQQLAKAMKQIDQGKFRQVALTAVIEVLQVIKPAAQGMGIPNNIIAEYDHYITKYTQMLNTDPVQAQSMPSLSALMAQDESQLDDEDI